MEVFAQAAQAAAQVELHVDEEASAQGIVTLRYQSLLQVYSDTNASSCPHFK